MNDSTTLAARMEAFRGRTLFYRNRGYDRFGAARLVAEMAGPLSGVTLDVGTGKAVLATTLAALRGVDVVTVDVDDTDRDLAELVAFESCVRDRIRFVRADAARLPFDDGQFGCAVTMDTLHHIADGAAVLSEMARVVAPGGTIVVADLTEPGFEILDEVHRSEGHEHPRSGVTVDSVLALAPGLGLSVIKRATGAMHDVAVLRKQGGDRTRRGAHGAVQGA